MAEKETVYCQLATRLDKTLHTAMKLHCVKTEQSVMGFVATAIANQLEKEKKQAASKKG